MLKLLVVVATAVAVVASGVPSTEQPVAARNAKFLAGLLGGRPRCPTPRPICPINCSIEPAVVYGYCCGCGGVFDFAPVPCPNWLQCPISPEPLCSDFRFVMDCCCGFGIAFPPFPIFKK